MPTVGSLFSGIGGFDLGFEWAGFRTVWFCEQDEFCRRVLEKHWPGVPCYPDVRTLRVADGGTESEERISGAGSGEAAPGRERRRRSGDGGRAPRVDCLIGGFPCQDVSLAGLGAGLEGARSGLWFEYLRIVGEFRPRVVVVENVPGLFIRGLDVVLGGLAALGYDAEWVSVRASDVGAPHRRERVFIIAYLVNAAGDRCVRRVQGEQLNNFVAGLADRASLSANGNPPAPSPRPVLNPRWVACLMGFPPDYLDGVAPVSRRSAMPSSRKLPKSLGDE